MTRHVNSSVVLTLEEVDARLAAKPKPAEKRALSERRDELVYAASGRKSFHFGGVR